MITYEEDGSAYWEPVAVTVVRVVTPSEIWLGFIDRIVSEDSAVWSYVRFTGGRESRYWSRVVREVRPRATETFFVQPQDVAINVIETYETIKGDVLDVFAPVPARP